MIFRLCALLLAVFLASCGGSSDDESSDTKGVSRATFAPPPVSPSIATPVSIPSSSAIPTPAPLIPVSSAEYSVKTRDVSETPSSKPQTITLNGNVIKFTASAGQLIAYENPGKPSNFDAEAAISYAAYTRDDLAHDQRPVTFVFNGGPGASGAALDLDFLGPKSFDADAKPGNGLPLKDNVNTLLDKTDLVFIDPVGTGYSEAIWPNKNVNYWGADSDAMVLRDFILRYVNVNNRQSSPKYIYGVSYGGFRAPIIGRLLIESGTTQYVADPTNKPAKTLTGLVLNSPILDLTTDCYAFWTSCGGDVPTYALIADYQKAKRQKASPQPVIKARVDELRAFAARFNDLYNKVFYGLARDVPDRSAWDAYIRGADGQDFVSKLVQLTGIGVGNDNPWIDNPNMDPEQFSEKLDPSKGELLLGDGRQFRPPETIDPALDRTDVQLDFMKVYQSQFMGYASPPAAPYLDQNGEIIDKWDYSPDIRISMTIGADRTLNTLPDLAFSLLSKVKPKVLIQHGYYDLITPFHQSELDLATAGLADSTTVSSYEGGHGIAPQDTGSYEQVMQQLRAFYDQPHSQLMAALKAAGSEGEDDE